MNELKGKSKRTWLVWKWFFVAAVCASVVFWGNLSAPEAGTGLFQSKTPGSFSKLVEKAKPAVVFISTVKTIKGGRNFFHPFRGPSEPGDPFRDFFDRFFDGPPGQRDFKQKGLGSGFLIDEEGYILTNNHVVEKSDEIMVTLANKKEYPAEIIGRDPKTDLALIRIQTEDKLVPLPLGDSDQLKVGDWVVAIGNPFGLGNTVTAGIVSFKSRNIGAGPYDDFIQTDAAINPGNSGGPLLNTDGEVIGINTAIFSRSGGNIGIGFAIPVNMAKDLIPQLKKGKVVRGWLGVLIQDITPELQEKLDLKDRKGALVADVTPGGPADEAGIRRGDVIVSFDGQPVDEMKELPYIVGSTPVGKSVVVEVIRKQKKKSFTIKVGEMKEEAAREKVEKPDTELGMVVEELTPQLARNFGLQETSGVIVVQVKRNSPAAEAGLRPGDLILEVDQEEVDRLSEFYDRIQRVEGGDTALLLIRRGDSTLFLTLRVEE